MPKSCDVLVIGAGPGGYVAAIRAAQLGKKVLVVERDALGGVCLNWGCIPSKALIHAATLADRLAHAEEIGVGGGPVKVDAKKLQSWKTGIVKQLTGGIASLFKGNGVEHVLGVARLTGPTTAEVTTTSGKEEVRFAHAILATGARPIEIPGFAFDGRTVIGSKEALALESVPKRLVVIGGGFIGLELGTVYAALGSEVTVLEMMRELLPGNDPELVNVVARKLGKRGVAVHLGAKAKEAKAGKGGMVVVAEIEGKAQEIPADVVLVAVGMRANSENLGLEKAGVKTDAKGFVPVNERLQTNVPNVFAIGDLTGPPLLAHRASHQGLRAAEAIAGRKVAFEPATVPGAVFTDPEIAGAGMTEQEARSKGLDVAVARFPFAALGRALAISATDGFTKIVYEKANGAVLGVFIVGANASDLISEGALAIEVGATLEDLALTIHPHPTLSESIMEAADVALGHPVHVVPRKERP
ncbi:MAG: dihydrolipoyl dehydrogenase [Methanobacteriota archaeon]